MTYYGNGKSDWPLAQVQRLRELAATGLSARQIGDKMGLTKNAVLGKANRAGVKMIWQPGYAYPKGAKGTRKRPLPLRIKLYDGWQRPRRMAVEMMAVPPKPPVEPPLSAAVDIMGLTSFCCRWPVAGIGAGMLYCGAATDAKVAYCPYHMLKAYQVRVR